MPPKLQRASLVRQSLQDKLCGYWCTSSSFGRSVQDEDVSLCDPFTSSRPWSVYAVMDGHRDAFVARNVKRMLPSILEGLMERMMPNGFGQGEDQVLNNAGLIRQAITHTFLLLDLTIKELQDSASDKGKKNRSGTTCTVVLHTGPLITVANVGHSHCALDSGASIVELSTDHRAGEVDEETERVKKAGGKVAKLSTNLRGPCSNEHEPGVGPFRVWPDALDMTRSLGDSTGVVLPYPHIKQVVVPKEGCRLILATDGVWECVPVRRGVKMLRNQAVENAARVLIEQVISRSKKLNDDATAIVVDVMPKGQFFKVVTNAKRGVSAPPSPVATPKRMPLLRCLSMPSVAEHSKQISAPISDLADVSVYNPEEEDFPIYSSSDAYKEFQYTPPPRAAVQDLLDSLKADAAGQDARDDMKLANRSNSVFKGAVNQDSSEAASAGVAAAASLFF